MTRDDVVILFLSALMLAGFLWLAWNARERVA